MLRRLLLRLLWNCKPGGRSLLYLRRRLLLLLLLLLLLGLLAGLICGEDGSWGDVLLLWLLARLLAV